MQQPGRWLVEWVRRDRSVPTWAGQPARIALALVAGAMLVSAALIGSQDPVWAQEGDGAAAQDESGAGATIRLVNLVDRITYSIVDRFEVELTNLSASETYEVSVVSNSPAAVGIDGCGEASQTRTVTGATAQNLTFIAYACALGSGTITAEVRRAGAGTVAASISQRLTVQPIPDYVPADERPVRGASGAVARVGTPGIVMNLQHGRWAKSFEMTWNEPADGGVALSGYGVLQWTGPNQPGWGQAVSIPATPRRKKYTGLQLDTVYKFRIHACSEDSSGVVRCGWWTDVHEVRTGRRPDPPHTISFTDETTSSAKVRWSAAANTGGVPITGFQIRYWPRSDSSDTTTVTADDGDRSKTLRGLASGTGYAAKLRACNDHDDCTVGAWSADHHFETPEATTPPPTTGRPAKPHTVSVTPHAERRTSLTVSWRAAGDTGGRPLTRFQVLRRRGDEDDYPPPIQAAEVEQDVMQYTYDGLEPGLTYWMKVRACNGDADADCSDWSDEASARVPSAPRPPGVPGDVTGVSFSNLTGTSFRVTWNAPQNNGGSQITGYGIQWRREPDGWPPTDQVVVVGVTPREWTFRNLDEGTHWVRIQACNGKRSCAPWPTTGHFVTIGETNPNPTPDPVVTSTPGPGNVPGKVTGVRFSGVGQTTFTMHWDVPAAGDGITNYAILRRERGESWPDESERVWLEDTARRYRVTGLTQNTMYEVKVKACRRVRIDRVTTRTTCGEWSDDKQVTTLRRIPQPPPPSRQCPTTSTTATSGPPRNIDVAPEWGRTITLCWSPVQFADTYVIEATESVRNIHSTTASDWHRIPNTPDVLRNVPNVDQKVQINLLELIEKPSGKIGLQDRDAFGIRIGAKFTSGHIEYSSPIIIVDTPILAANGDTRPSNNTRQVSIGWTSIFSVLHDINYANGQHHVRFWRHDRGRAYVGPDEPRWWHVSSFEQNRSDPVTVTPHRVAASRFTAGRIYPVQLVYRKDNDASTNDTDVFGARFSFVWPSDRPVASYDSDHSVWFASYRLKYPLRTRTYEYRICTDSFPADTVDDWVPFINHAFGQWETATKIGSRTLFSMRYNNGPCTDYSDVQLEIREAMVDAAATTPGFEHLNNAQIVQLSFDLRDEVTGIIGRMNVTNLTNNIEDSGLNEVTMLDDLDDPFTDPPLKKLVVATFTQFGDEIGFVGNLESYVDNDTCWEGAVIACAKTDKIVGTVNEHTTDIFLRRSQVKHDALRLPGGDEVTDRSDLKFNKCDYGKRPGEKESHSVYGVLVHEAGHALGFRPAHPEHPDSVMTAKVTDYNCSPHPLDVLGMYAMYQS